MKVIVLTAFYPIPNVTHERMFVHVRNLYYKSQGVDVTVLNFDSSNDYVIDQIRVITLKTFKLENQHYDIAISHSANLRNHYIFLKKYADSFKHLIFFFHGHEVLYLNRDYPKPYQYMRTGGQLKRLLQDVYDWLKINLWKNYYKKLASKSYFIFVSNWVLDHYKLNSGIKEENLLNHVFVINNSVGEEFENKEYDFKSKKNYDFVSIRSNIDGSKYCVDIIVKYAQINSDKLFLLIGQGKFFEHYPKPDNLIWINQTINHTEMLHYLDESRCGLMPTREDTQGVMTCEMMEYGMPVITSDISVCNEFFSNVNNVKLISNDKIEDIVGISNQLFLKLPYKKPNLYIKKKTMERELELIRELCEE